MPKREDETYRNVYPHPAYCTCWECTQKRLKASRDASLTAFCPVCHKKSLFYNRNSGQYECLNSKCKATGRTLEEIRRYDRYMTPEETTRAVERAAERQRSGDVEYAYPSRTKKGERLPRWLKPTLVSIFAWVAVILLVLWFSGLFTNPQTEVFEPAPTGENTPPQTPSSVEIPTSREGISVSYNTQPPYAGAVGFQVQLLNNEGVSNPIWQELAAFLKLDETDKGTYLLGARVCADFVRIPVKSATCPLQIGRLSGPKRPPQKWLGEWHWVETV